MRSAGKSQTPCLVPSDPPPAPAARRHLLRCLVSAASPHVHGVGQGPPVPVGVQWGPGEAPCLRRGMRISWGAAFLSPAGLGLSNRLVAGQPG